MSHRIPAETLQQIYCLSLIGWSIRAIAHSVQVSVGSTQSILQEFKSQDPDYSLLRALAVNLHKNGLDVPEYAWLVRSRNILLKAWITNEEAEKIVCEVPVFCHRAGLNPEILVDLLKRFREYLQANPADPRVCNVIVESFHYATEYYKKRIRGNDDVQINPANKEQELKNVLENVIRDEEIIELNEGTLADYVTKDEVLEKILDVIKNPSVYEDLFLDI